MDSIVKAGLNQDMEMRPPEDIYPLMKGLMTLDSNPVPIKAAGDERRYTARHTSSAGSIGRREGSSAFRSSSAFQYSLIF
ncbi:MAG: hypothetical protein ACLT8C_02240 [Akkermansia muciniphila]